MQQFCCGGLNFGYFYTGSPIIASDGEAPPAYSMGDFTPSTVPGCRAPHFWLADGRSLYDAFGPGLHAAALRPQRRRRAAGGRRAARAACRSRCSMWTPPTCRAAYRHRLVLCRADQHVAWRGDRVPVQSDELVAQLRGQVRETAAVR